MSALAALRAGGPAPVSGGTLARGWTRSPHLASLPALRSPPPAEGLYSCREAEAPGLALGLLLVPWVLAAAGALHVRQGLAAGAPRRALLRSREGGGRHGSRTLGPTWLPAVVQRQWRRVGGVAGPDRPARRRPAGFLAFGMRTALAASALTVVLLVMQLPAGEVVRADAK